MITRRDLLKGIFGLGAAGLLLPTRKVWALDSTMIPVEQADTPVAPVSRWTTDWFDMQMPTKHEFHLATIVVDDGTPFKTYDMFLIDHEPFWVHQVHGNELTVYRQGSPLS